MIYDYKGDEVKTSSITERDYHCSFALFQRIGVLGDSYANGNFGETPSATNDVGHPSLSWPQQLARRQGVHVYNFSVGGQSTRSFLTNTGDTGITALENSPACGLYILALERNDYNYEKNGHDGYIGDITDITGHSYGSYPDTFYGNYATIIERILLHAPNARFVVMVGDYSSSNVLGTAYNNAMIEIAEHYSIPYMEQLSDQYFLGSNSYYRDKSPAGHPAPYAYSGMELAIERLFDKCLKENKEYFMYYLGVQLTDKEKTANKFDLNVLAGNFAPIEVSPSQNPYSVGDRLVYNGLLYTVTSAIAEDDLLVVGTNIERKTVDGALSDISDIYGSISSDNTKDIQLPASYKGMLVTSCPSSTGRDICLISSTSSGTITFTALRSASGISLSNPSLSVLRITNSAGYAISYRFFNLPY